MARSTDTMLHRLQKESYEYFHREYNPATGLVRDKTEAESPASIAVTGFAVAVGLVAAERGFIARREALRRALAAVRFLADSDQGAAADATGQRGFYYHFLEMEGGRRAWNCELSTIDTGLLLAGLLAAGEYFSGDNARERELRDCIEGIYRRIDWRWACHGGLTLTHGYKPESGFLPHRWRGYNEGLLLYVLGLGAPTHPLSAASYRAWTRTYEWKTIYGYGCLHAGPLFIHQFPHAWIDFRGLQDDFMRGKSSDYFENSRRATYIQREYCRRNPRGFPGYSELNWGLTACDGPGPCRRRIRGRTRRFLGYCARGVPDGPDDGTLSAGAAVASLPFAPEIVLPTIGHFLQTRVDRRDPCGFATSFNRMYPDPATRRFWRSRYNFGLNHGPMILMIENYRSGLIWRLLRGCRPIVRGLERCGFSGGWLTAPRES